MLPFCHFLSYESNRKKSFTKVTFDIFYMMIAICYMLSVIRYLWLAISYFFSETCYYFQKLVPFARCCTSRNFKSLILHFLRIGLILIGSRVTFSKVPSHLLVASHRGGENTIFKNIPSTQISIVFLLEDQKWFLKNIPQT